MVTVKLFGTARVKFHEKEFQVEASTVKELTEVLALRYSVKPKEFKQFLTFVNDVNINKLKMFRTKLADGDVVMLLSPASGG